MKLHPDIQAFALDDPRALKIFELCERENVPALLHTGDYRYDYSNPNRLLPVLKAYPSLTVIGAHLGGWSNKKSGKIVNFGLTHESHGTFSYLCNASGC